MYALSYFSGRNCGSMRGDDLVVLLAVVDGAGDVFVQSNCVRVGDILLRAAAAALFGCYVNVGRLFGDVSGRTSKRTHDDDNIDIRDKKTDIMISKSIA